MSSYTTAFQTPLFTKDFHHSTKTINNLPQKKNQGGVGVNSLNNKTVSQQGTIFSHQYKREDTNENTVF